MNTSPLSALPPPARRCRTSLISRLAVAACAAAVFVSAAHAVVPMIVTGSSDVASYVETPWTLQKTGTFVAGATAGTGTVTWTVTATAGTPTATFSVIGYVDMANGTSQPVQVRSLAVNLQRVVGGDFATVSSDIADSTLGDAATATTVDPDITYEGLDTFQENAASGSLVLHDAANTVVTLNGAGQTVPAQSTSRLYFIATFNAAALNVVPGEPLQIEAIVNFPPTFIMPSLPTLTAVTAPTPVAANGTVSLADPSVTASGTVTTGAFTGISQSLSASYSTPVSLTVDGGANGGTVCNTATLTSPATTIPLVVNGSPVPLIVISGVNLTASDCQPVPKRPGTPHPISTTINSCSQVVTYDASLFTSPNGPIVSASFNPASGSTFPFGTSTVDYSVTDSQGVTATGVLYVNVIDSDAPVIAPVANIVVNAPQGSCTATVGYTTTATDCNLKSIVFSPVSGSTFPIGTSTVTITATDTANHQSTSTFTVTVKDAEAPTITSPLSDITLQPDRCHCSATFCYTPKAVDNCGGAVKVTVSPASGTVLAGGTTTTVTVTATDSAGNVTTRTFKVTVGACSLAQTTYTQGGWGAKPHGNNPGTLLWRYFSTVYPHGLTVGGHYTAKFTSASAITNALPLTGTPAALTKSVTNPTSGNTFESQVIALTLNVDFSARDLFPVNGSSLGTMKLVSGELAGWTVNQVLSLCNTVLGGNTGALPPGVTIADLTGIADSINRNFDNGKTNNGYLKY